MRPVYRRHGVVMASVLPVENKRRELFRRPRRPPHVHLLVVAHGEKKAARAERDSAHDRLEVELP